MVSLRGRPRTRREPLARVGRLDQVAGVHSWRLVTAPSGTSSCYGLPPARVSASRFSSTAGSTSAAPGWAASRWPGGRLAGLIGPWLHDPAGTGWLRGFPCGLVSTRGLDHTLLGGTGPVLELVNLVLVLAVDPGWPGHLPSASTKSRVRTVRELAAGLDIAVQVGVDGGVTIANAAEIASWGGAVVVSGSPIYDGIDPPATCAACSTSCVPQLASRTPSLAEEEAHVHQRHTPDRPAANPYEDHPDRRGSP